jgi:hypothetical protein
VPMIVYRGGGPQSSYTTSFPLTENPISESGRWVNGLTTGLDWQNIRTSAGLAYGTQSGNSGTYDDSTALLSGTWLQNTTIVTTCKTVNQQGTFCYCELEHRHRSLLSAHSNTGYEINVRANHGFPTGGASYTQIVRWNGAIGAFVMLKSVDEGTGNFTGLHDGDVFKSTFIGTVINVYIDYGSGFVLVNTYDTSTGNDGGTPGTPDSVVYSGNPGMGHWLHLNGATGVNLDDYGFHDYTVTAT